MFIVNDTQTHIHHRTQGNFWKVKTGKTGLTNRHIHTRYIWLQVTGHGGYKTYTQYIYIAAAVAVTNTQTSQTHKHVCCTQEITHVEAVPPHLPLLQA